MKEAIDIELWIEEGEKAIKEAKAELHELLNKKMVDALTAAGCDEWKDKETGYKVAVKELVTGTLPKEPDARAKALAWMSKNGGDPLIKNEITIELEKGSNNLATQVRGALDELEVPYESKEGIHPQSLAAFARERMERGEKVPLETLGLYAARQAKISAPRKTKPRI